MRSICSTHSHKYSGKSQTSQDGNSFVQRVSFVCHAVQNAAKEKETEKEQEAARLAEQEAEVARLISADPLYGDLYALR